MVTRVRTRRRLDVTDKALLSLDFGEGMILHKKTFEEVMAEYGLDYLDLVELSTRRRDSAIAEIAKKQYQENRHIEKEFLEGDLYFIREIKISPAALEVLGYGSVKKFKEDVVKGLDEIWNQQIKYTEPIYTVDKVYIMTEGLKQPEECLLSIVGTLTRSKRKEDVEKNLKIGGFSYTRDQTGLGNEEITRDYGRSQEKKKFYKPAEDFLGEIGDVSGIPNEMVRVAKVLLGIGYENMRASERAKQDLKKLGIPKK